MKRLPFGLLAGGLVTAIISLMLAAGWLAASIADRELVSRSTIHPWTTATFQLEKTTLSVGSTSTDIEMPTFSLSATATPTFIAPTSPALPLNHPPLGSNPQSCTTCHQNVHGGGG